MDVKNLPLNSMRTHIKCTAVQSLGILEREGNGRGGPLHLLSDSVRAGLWKLGCCHLVLRFRTDEVHDPPALARSNFLFTFIIFSIRIECYLRERSNL